MMEMNFCGHSAAYWLDLEDRFRMEQTLAAPDLLEEVLVLRGKVSFYEDRIRQMAEVARA